MAKSPLLPQQVDGNLIVGVNPTKLRDARKTAGYTQAGLAAKVGVTKGYISQLERGVRKPALDTIKSLAAALGVQVEAVCVYVPDYPGGAA